MISSRQRFINVTVSRPNIDLGEQNSFGHCPIARALKVMGFNSPRVAKDLIRFTDPDTGERYQFACPNDASDWLREYDTLGPKNVEPFTFRLDLKMATIMPKQKPSSRTGSDSVPRTRSKAKGFRPNEMVWW